MRLGQAGEARCTQAVCAGTTRLHFVATSLCRDLSLPLLHHSPSKERLANRLEAMSTSSRTCLHACMRAFPRFSFFCCFVSLTSDLFAGGVFRYWVTSLDAPLTAKDAFPFLYYFFFF